MGDLSLLHDSHRWFSLRIPVLKMTLIPHDADTTGTHVGRMVGVPQIRDA